MRRRSLALDHFAGPPRLSWYGITLLALAILAAMTLAAWQRQLLGELDVLQTQQQLALPGTRRPSAAAMIEPRRRDEALRSAQRVSLDLRLPWNALLDAIEAATDPSVALLTIEPDGRRAAVRISGEARHKQAMLDFMGRLGMTRPFVHTVLESHAQNRTGAKAPVRFTLLAHWKGGP